MKYIIKLKNFTENKNFKKFENSKNTGFYWKVNTKQPNFRISLDKIGMPIDKINIFSAWFHNSEDIYVFKEVSGLWSWVSIDADDSKWDNIYMGEIKITKDDIEKWEVKEAAKKYNL
jgi:hypothetical protein